MKLLDLYCGFGGAHRCFAERGWAVTAVDIERGLSANVVADCRHLPIRPGGFDVIWASPPCQAYARKHLPWTHGTAADVDSALELVEAARDFIRVAAPQFWIIENTRFGGREIARVLGAPTMHVGSWVFWGNFPLVLVERQNKGAVYTYGTRALRPWLRSIVPYHISDAFERVLARSVRRGGDSMTKGQLAP